MFGTTLIRWVRQSWPVRPMLTALWSILRSKPSPVENGRVMFATASLLTIRFLVAANLLLRAAHFPPDTQREFFLSPPLLRYGIVTTAGRPGCRMLSQPSSAFLG